mmetsp:Transcript_31862/g.90503  ORF Transcript_31862/g.90503 Transcript_31862/m.90503 type:complete len:788 (+) Transcript_31862:469-2832(+)
MSSSPRTPPSTPLARAESAPQSAFPSKHSLPPGHTLLRTATNASPLVLSSNDYAPSSSSPGETASSVTIGIVRKYIHVQGWRMRLFVLKGGILRYYKIHGEEAVNCHAIYEKYSRLGEVQVIGTEFSAQRAISARANPKPYGKGEPKSRGELHLQVVNLSTSNADVRKLYLHNGVSQIAVKAESRDDRRAWLSAILSSKGHIMMTTASRASMMLRLSKESVCFADNPQEDAAEVAVSRFKNTITTITDKLRQAGVKMELIEEVEGVLSEEHVTICNLMGKEKEKRLRLLEYLQQIQDEKRELETTIVVDANEAVKGKNLNANGEDLEEDQSSGSTGELDACSEVGVTSDSDDDEFFECETSSVSARSEHRRTLSGGSPPSTANSPFKRHISMTAAEPPDFSKDVAVPTRRTQLPVPAEKEKSVSLWSIIRDCIGKDLTRICLPVYFNEPISALQKSAEDMEYSELLDAAATCDRGSQRRLLLVAAFAASSYSSTVGRTRKPFNPLLGETYELVMPEKGFKFISEKVCHHPTILCANCTGRGWLFQGDGEVKSKFWGRYIELHPVGTLQVTFSDGEVYTWNKVVTSINNLIIGKLYIDHGGLMRVVNKSTGLQAKLRFKETGMLDRSPRQIRGHLEGKTGSKLPGNIAGKWDEFLSFHSGAGDEEVLWQANPQPSPASNRYNMTAFSILLNEKVWGHVYAPTDCRLRPDQRALEDGRYSAADTEKQRLEHKQRQARKAAQEGVPIEPRWFERVKGVQLGEAVAYRYKGGYFECSVKGCFDGCRDIFGS